MQIKRTKGARPLNLKLRPLLFEFFVIGAVLSDEGCRMSTNKFLIILCWQSNPCNPAVADSIDFKLSYCYRSDRGSFMADEPSLVSRTCALALISFLCLAGSSPGQTTNVSVAP